MPLAVHNGAMIRDYLPEFLAAVFMSVLLLVAYSMRGAQPPRPPRTPVVATQPRFLLEVESPQQRLRIDLEGKVTGPVSGQLTLTELQDLRAALTRVSPGTTEAAQAGWKLRYYDSQGAHEEAFEPGQAPAEIQHILENLKLLGYLKAPLRSPSGGSSPLPAPPR